MFVASISFGQVNLSLLGQVDFNGQTCAGVWHYVDSLNNEYALVGVADKVSIVDVTNPATAHEVFSVPAPASSLWRELKTYNGYAYAVSEGGGGVIIIDLRYLPDSIVTKTWNGNGPISGTLNTAHTVAATDGYLYVFGSNLANGGAIIADLSDPWNPDYVGEYNLNYIHDGYIRNDTLWAGEIYAGIVSVINVADKTNPTVITSFSTPGQFTHNAWLSDNSQYLFTTDEEPNEPMASFDVSDLSNVQLLDEYLTDSMPDEEVHNVRVLNDYIIAPSYGSQLTICDGARPNNIVEIANYPTGTFLCWDASPYLPSGNIVVTDVESHLYIFSPTYIRACYLEGTVTDSTTGIGIPNASIEIVNEKSKTSQLTGAYALGTVHAGTYDLIYSKPGYISKTFTGVTLSNGVLTTMDVQLVPFTLNASVTDIANGMGVQNAFVSIQNAGGTYNFTSDVNGAFTVSGITTGTYDLIVSHWGYNEVCSQIIIDGVTPINIQLQRGYADDFQSDLGWTVTSTSTGGHWTRVVPVGTVFGGATVNPDVDAQDDCGNAAFVTGNIGGNPNNDDVDNGNTVLTSPVFDLTGYTDPYVNYERWFFMQPGIPASSYDTLTIMLNNGITTSTIDYATFGTTNSQWIQQSLRVNNFITPTANMRLTVTIEDKQIGGNILEGGFDRFSVSEGPLGIGHPANNAANVKVYPNPFNGQCRVELPAGITGDVTADITDLSGRTISTEKLDASGYLRSAATLKQGIYILRLTNALTELNPVRIVRQ